MRARMVREVGLPAPRLLGQAGRPLTCYFAHGRSRRSERVRDTVAMLPGLLDHVDELRDEGTIGCDPRSANVIAWLFG